MVIHRVLASLAAVGVLAFCNGCGSSVSTTSTTTGQALSKPIGGGTAKCTSAEVQKALSGAAGGKSATLISSTCEDGWMVLLAAVDGPDSPPSTFVFQAEGPFWALQNRTTVCMPPSPVPKDLQQVACSVN
jgi:hypothetical protein